MATPTRAGFGRQLIEGAMACELGPESQLRFASAGVECDIRIPTSFVVSDAAADTGGAGGEAEGAVGSLDVMVVEDLMITAMDLDRILKCLGHRVCGPTAHVAQALSLVEDEEIDIAILDNNPGYMDSSDIAGKRVQCRIPFFPTGYDPKSFLPRRYAQHPCLSEPFDEAAIRRAI